MKVRHGLENGFHSVTERKFIDDFLLSFFKVDFPGIFTHGLWKLDVPFVEVRHVIEEVLVEASVLNMVGGRLSRTHS